MVGNTRLRLWRTLALTGSGLLVSAAFLRWEPDGRTALDIGLGGPGAPRASLALALILVAAAPAVAVLAPPRPWPPLLAAGLSVMVEAAWTGWGPSPSPSAGVRTALAGSVVLILAARLTLDQTSRRPEKALPSVTSSA